MIDTVVTFVTPGTRVQGSDGVWRDGTQTTRDVFARMSSVDRSEFYAGGESGFRPEMRFLVFQAEYRGESVLIWNGKAYAVYRTYLVPGTDDLEVYVQREVGVHNGGQNADRPAEQCD